MENERGGGKCLEARDNYSFSSRSRSRYGHEAIDLFDERDDDSWIEVDGDDYEDDCVSHLGFDENTFASSFATNVHVRGSSSIAGGSVRSKRTTFHPSTKQGPSAIRQRGGRIQSVDKGAITAKGGSCAAYCTVHWLGTDSHGHSMRRVSHHVVFLSGDIKKMLKCVRVSGDNKQFVIQMYRPKYLWDANSQCDWLAEEISSEYYPLPEAQTDNLFKVHQRRVAMEQHTAKHFTPGEIPVDELRLDCAGIKVDPNFVTKSEDLVCYGASIWKEDDGTIRGNFELKELGKGSTETNQDVMYGMNLQEVRGHSSKHHVPSSISVGSKSRRTSHAHLSRTNQDMDIDSSYYFDEEEEYLTPQNGKDHFQCFCKESSKVGSDDMAEYAWERAIANAERLYLEGKAEFDEQFGEDGGSKPAAKPSIQVETVNSNDSEAYDGAAVASPKKKATTTASVAAVSTTSSSPRRSKRKAKQQEKVAAEGPKEDDSSSL